MLFYNIYILYSLKDKRLYVGFTSDLEKRVEHHNSGGNRSTLNRRPLRLIYSETFISKKDARKREKFYKTGRGREILKKQLEDTFAGMV